jgi:hypothetical protein
VAGNAHGHFVAAADLISSVTAVGRVPVRDAAAGVGGLLNGPRQSTVGGATA